MTDNPNLHLWNTLRSPPPDALKTILAGRLKGKSDINPQWRYEALTAAFGPCGLGWRFEIVERWSESVSTGEVMAFVKVELYAKIGESWTSAIPAFGGSMLVENEKNGPHASDEAFKMATTDALGTAAKMLGLAADVYRGQLDTKYAPAHASDQPLPGGWAATTPSQKAKATVAAATAAPSPTPGALPGTDWAGFEPANPDNPSCPKCKGKMYDYREKARGGRGQYPKDEGDRPNPNKPDFSCAKGKACGGAFWPAKESARVPSGRANPPAAPYAPVKDGWPDEQPPLTDADAEAGAAPDFDAVGY